MNAKKSRLTERLIALVEEAKASDPFERGGYQWAAMPMDEWAKRADRSKRSLEDDFKRPPFYSEMATKKVAGRDNPVRVKIVRVLATGETPKKTPLRVANELRKVWLAREIDHDVIAAKAAAGKPMQTAGLLDGGKVQMSSNDHGCLIGLAETWPDGKQRAILKMVLADWGSFMSAVKAEKMALQDAETGDTDLPLQENVFLKYPHLPTIRRFANVALELFTMHEQAKAADKIGKKPLLMAAE